MSLPPPPPPPMVPPPAAPLPQCPWHPARDAGRSCTRCGRAACSECLTPAVVGSHCPDCVRAARPELRDRARMWNSGQHALVTTLLIGLNLAVFTMIAVSEPESLGSGITNLQIDLGLNRWPLALDGQWYRLVTSGFLHFGLIHLAFNMLLLYQLGQLLERSLGRVRFSLLYGASLLGGAFGALALMGNTLAITGGASGAVFGLMAAAAVGLQRQGVNVMSTGIGTTLLLNLLLTFAIPGISIGGHLGGAVAGAVAGWFMLPPRWRRMPTWVGYLTPVAIALVCIIGSVTVVELAL